MVNAVASSIVANSAIVRLGAGSLCVYTLQAADVIVDVSGWIAPGGLGSTPVEPLRLVDTRPGERQVLPVPQHRLGTGQMLTVDVAGATWRRGDGGHGRHRQRDRCSAGG